MTLDFRLPVRFLPEFFNSANVVLGREVSFCSYRPKDFDGHKVALVTTNKPSLINDAKAARADMLKQQIITKSICLRTFQLLPWRRK